MGIRDDANGLDAALKRSTNSARQLSLAIADSSNNIGHAVHAAAELAEGLAKASKVGKLAEMSTGIGLIVAAIGTVIAGTVLWKDKQEEIVQQTREIHAATAALNAQAKNNDRLAAEIKISAEKQKQLEAVEKEQKALLGLGKHLHDYSRVIAAINANATAQLSAVNADISRKFASEQASIAEDNRRIIAQRFGDQRGGVADLDKQQVNLAAVDLTAKLRSIDENSKYSQEQKEQLAKQYGDQFEELVKTIHYNSIKPLGDALGRSFASSIADGIAAGVQSGSIEKGFRNLTGGMLIGLGRMMVEIGTQSLLAANLMNTIVSSLKAFAPAGAIGPSLALIALGGIVMGLGAAMSSGGSGGGGGGGRGGGGGGYSNIPTIVDRGIIDPTQHSSMASGSLTPRGTFVYAPTQIGIDDARAHRDFAKFKAAARSNGHDV